MKASLKTKTAGTIAAIVIGYIIVMAGLIAGAIAVVVWTLRALGVIS